MTARSRCASPTLEAINFNKTDLDTKGVAFEQFLDGFFKGDFGQYFTPREIIQFTVEMLKPTADDYVLDPRAALAASFFTQWTTFAMRPRSSTTKMKRPLVSVTGTTSPRTGCLAWRSMTKSSRVAKMNMILHDDGHTNIVGFRCVG